MTEPQESEAAAPNGVSGEVRGAAISVVVTALLNPLVATLTVVPLWGILLGDAVIAAALVLVVVRPARDRVGSVLRASWTLRPETHRRAEARIDLVRATTRRTLDAVHLAREVEAQHAERDLAEAQIEIARLAKAKDAAEKHLNLFISEAEYTKRKTTELQFEVMDLRGLKTQFRDVSTKLTAADQRALIAEGELRQAKNQIAALTATATTHQEHLAQAFEKARSWEVRAKKVEGELKSSREVARERVDPVPQPRWRILTPWDDPTEPLRLVNLVTGSVTRQVRIESDDDYYRINDAGYWDVIEGGDGKPFAGMLTKLGRQQGATIWIYWVDEDGEQRQDTQKIDAVEAPAPVSYDAWGTPDI